MNAREMLIAQIKAAGGDGLAYPEIKCGCGIEDMGPCDCVSLDDCKVARASTLEADDPAGWGRKGDRVFVPM